MPWLSPNTLLDQFQAAFTAAEADGSLVSVSFKGSSFDLCRAFRVSDDLVVRIKHDPAVEVVGAVERVLQVLGIERDIVPIAFHAADGETGEGRTVHGGPCRYAALVHQLGHEDCRAVPAGDVTQRAFERDDDPVTGTENVPLGPHEQKPH